MTTIHEYYISIYTEGKINWATDREMKIMFCKTTKIERLRLRTEKSIE